MFRHRQQLRRWAAQVLLLWLFGIGTGFANACLASTMPTPQARGSTHASNPGNAHHDVTTAGAAHHHDATQVRHDGQAPDQQGSPSRTNCQDFCDKSGVTIPSLKSALDDLQGHALPLSTAVPALPAPTLQLTSTWMPRRDGVLVVSIPLVFLRLAL